MKGRLFGKIESLVEVQRAKEKFSENSGHKILEIYKVLVQVRLSTSKMELRI